MESDPGRQTARMDRIVAVEGKRSAWEPVASVLDRLGVEAIRVENLTEAPAILSTQPHLLVVLCLDEIESEGLVLLARLLKVCQDTPVVPVASFASLEIALRVIRLGAFDLLIRPLTEETVRGLLGRARALRQAALLRKLTVLAQLSNWFVHEVRNPLSGILNGAQLLTEKSSPSGPGHDYLKIITEEGDRLERFLRRLTEVGRSSHGPIVPVVLNAVVERALSCSRPHIRTQGIRVQRRFDPRLPEVQIEVESVERVIRHVIEGALERMPKGGVMSLLTRYRSAEEMIELEVADTGGEISLGHDRQPFDLFFSTKREATLGLGLASALRTFGEHGGGVSFHSHAGQGGVVLLQLPLKRP